MQTTLPTYVNGLTEPQSAKSTSLKAYSTEAGKAIGVSNEYLTTVYTNPV